MAEAGRRPSGVVTLLFSDVVGSTERLDRLGDDGAEDVRCNQEPTSGRCAAVGTTRPPGRL